MAKLKPCPFCGGKAKLNDTVWPYYWVECTNCEILTQAKDTAETAINLWNRRVRNEDD